MRTPFYHRLARGKRVPATRSTRAATPVCRLAGCPRRASASRSRPERPLVLFDGACGFCKAWIARWRLHDAGRGRLRDLAGGGRALPGDPARGVRGVGRSSSCPTEACSRAPRRSRACSRFRAGGGLSLWAYRSVPGARPLGRSSRIASIARHRPRRGGRDARSCGGAVRCARPIARRTRSSCGSWACATSPRSSRSGSRSTAWSARAAILPVRRLPRLGADAGRRRSATGSLRRSAGSAPADAALHALCAGGALASLLLIAGVAAGGRRGRRLGLLPLARRRGPGLPGVPVGPAAARGGAPRDLPGAAAALARRRAGLAALRALALPARLAALPPDVLLGRRQALERRSRPGASLTALRYHYETQPLPPWIGVVRAPTAPRGSTTASRGVMFSIELAVPFFFFAPRRLRAASPAG